MTYPKLIEYYIECEPYKANEEQKAAAKQDWLNQNATYAGWETLVGYSGLGKTGSFESYQERMAKKFDDDWYRDQPTKTTVVRNMAVYSPEDEARIRASIEGSKLFKGWLA